MFEDRFLIADVKMTAEFPTERWFWFEPPFHDGGSTLLARPGRRRLADRPPARLGCRSGGGKEAGEGGPPAEGDAGPGGRFELEWVSVYTFQCRRLEKFRHGRIVFVGDSATPGVAVSARGRRQWRTQDADNLAWKLAAVTQGRAPVRLIDSYDAERIPAGRRNIHQFNPFHRLHHAKGQSQPAVPRCGAGPVGGPSLCPPLGQFRPAVPASPLCRHATLSTPDRAERVRCRPRRARTAQTRRSPDRTAVPAGCCTIWAGDFALLARSGEAPHAWRTPVEGGRVVPPVKHVSGGVGEPGKGAWGDSEGMTYATRLTLCPPQARPTLIRPDEATRRLPQCGRPDGAAP